MNAVDTNVLIYACDGRDPLKQERALALVGSLDSSVLLWQVACEFVAASRKLAGQGFTPVAAWDRLAEFAAIMPIVAPTPNALQLAKAIHLDRGVSFWDSVLLGACLDAGVSRLHSEDVPGGRIEGIEVVNPFA